MYIMNICSRYIIRVNNTTYSTDSVELIPIVIHLLGGAKAFGRCALRIIISHNATLGSCQLAYFDRLGVYHKDIFPTVYALGNIPADVFCKTSREFATDVELSSGYKVRDMFGRFSQSLKEVVLAVITECFGCKRKRKSYNFQIRKGGNNSTARYIAMFIYTISCKFLADVVDFCEFFDEVVHTTV